MIDDAPTKWTPDDAQAYATSVLSGRLTRLRGLRERDLPDLVRWRQSVPVDILQSDSVNPMSDERARALMVDIAGNLGQTDTHRGFCVETIPEGDEPARLLGVVSLGQMTRQHRSAVFAIALDPDQGGKGYGQDATRTMIRYGFRELGLHRIELHVWSYNARALATYRKSGFVEEGRLRDVVFHDGRWHDEHIMSVLSTDEGF